MSRRLEHWLQLVGPTPPEPTRATWSPAADVYRCRDGWLIKFDLAGVRPEDVTLRVADCRIVLEGVRRDWQLADVEQSYRLEISYNRFERSIELPGDLERCSMSTDYREGMLLVRLCLGD